MPEITTSFKTASAAKYLQQMCKHFAHKVPATCDADTGEVTFEFGTCRMQAGDEALAISITSSTDDDLQRLVYVIESHLARFAWRENCDLQWTGADGTVVPKATKVADMLSRQQQELAGKRRT